MPLFRLGDHGSAVAEIRAILVGLGLLPDGGDPVFDEACDRAIRAFQQQRGLIVDGIVGPATYRVLREASYRLGARVLSYQLSAPMVGDDVHRSRQRLLGGHRRGALARRTG